MKRISMLLGLTAALSFVTGCDLYEDGHITTKKVQIEDEQISERVGAHEIDESFAAALADDFIRRGDGILDIAVLYDPLSRDATPMRASQEAARIAQLLRSNGVSEVKTVILPVQGGGDEIGAMINYTAYNAKAPDCKVMDGMESPELTLNGDYEMGCSVQTIFAKQIARPKDLKGQGGLPDASDGRRAGNIVEGYRSGVQNRPLEGESASGDE